jgi:hypothetical protein
MTLQAAFAGRRSARDGGSVNLLRTPTPEDDMPDISRPEVRLKDKLPEGLRDMTMDDIQRAMPEVHMPRMDLGRSARKARKGAERAARDAQKAAAREAANVSRAVGKALPQRSGPNPVPIALLAMLGGLVVGWILANSPTTGPRISAWLDDLRMRWDEWRGRGGVVDEDWAAEPQAYPESLRAPIASEPYSGNLSESETGVGVGPGELPEGMGTSDPARVGADDRI